MTAFVLLTFAVALILSAAATGLMRRLAPRWGLVDAPDAARKVHTTPTPLGGGAAVWFAVIAPLLSGVAVAAAVRQGWLPESIVPTALRPHLAGTEAKLATLLAVLGAGSVLTAVGLWDDRRGLPWGWRLLVQFACAGIVVAAGVRFSLFLPGLSGRIAATTLTVLWLVVLTNAFNFLDNMNGLCSGTAAIAAAVLATIMLASLPRPHWFVGAMALTLCGALIGFLIHNWGGRIFLGDAGSTFVGFMLAACCALGTFYEAPVQGEGAGIHGFGNHVIFAPLCVLAVPLYDFATVLTIRLRDGASPFRPDRNHFSHRLTDRGLSKRGAVKTVWLCTLVTGLAGLLLYRVDGWVGASLCVAVVAGVLGIVAVLEFSTRRGGAAMPGLVPRPPGDGAAE
ncbi:MraY family glycosyltransferase [Alienimonas californiensis]|uniref:WecA-like glycosyltransferase n=1 Tax=Alienimonas californiensis TaxID=2527989 RepID=A0A517PEX6_9PLAN|nr:MraY family glycosyltransferase [Alienimonas californiensis]QDT17927.1 WecA-like glycosyltransferase [Alienimonas californiensis]